MSRITGFVLVGLMGVVSMPANANADDAIRVGEISKVKQTILSTEFVHKEGATLKALVNKKVDAAVLKAIYAIATTRPDEKGYRSDERNAGHEELTAAAAAYLFVLGDQIEPLADLLIADAVRSRNLESIAYAWKQSIITHDDMKDYITSRSLLYNIKSVVAPKCIESVAPLLGTESEQITGYLHILEVCEDVPHMVRAAFKGPEVLHKSAAYSADARVSIIWCWRYVHHYDKDKLLDQELCDEHKRPMLSIISYRGLIETKATSHAKNELLDQAWRLEALRILYRLDKKKYQQLVEQLMQNEPELCKKAKEQLEEK